MFVWWSISYFFKIKSWKHYHAFLKPQTTVPFAVSYYANLRTVLDIVGLQSTCVSASMIDIKMYMELVWFVNKIHFFKDIVYLILICHGQFFYFSISVQTFPKFWVGIFTRLKGLGENA